MLPPVTLELGADATLKCPDFRWEDVYPMGKHRSPGPPGFTAS